MSEIIINNSNEDNISTEDNTNEDNNSQLEKENEIIEQIINNPLLRCLCRFIQPLALYQLGEITV